MGKTKNPGGRPSKQATINQKQFEQLMQLKPKLQWVANYFNVSDETIMRYCRERFNQSFVELRDKKMMAVRANLIQGCITGAEKGNTALRIFALKNLCGWADQPDPFEDEDQESQITFE